MGYSFFFLSSNSILTEGPYVSSNWPLRMLHTKATRNKIAMVSEMEISKTIISMTYKFDLNSFRATQLTASEVNPTTLTLLIGIKMAAISGVKNPLMATLSAIAL